jgi:hypothetical protein
MVYHSAIRPLQGRKMADGRWGAPWDEVTLLSISYIIATRLQTIWGVLEISGDATHVM